MRKVSSHLCGFWRSRFWVLVSGFSVLGSRLGLLTLRLRLVISVVSVVSVVANCNQLQPLATKATNRPFGRAFAGCFRKACSRVDKRHISAEWSLFVFSLEYPLQALRCDLSEPPSLRFALSIYPSISLSLSLSFSLSQPLHSIEASQRKPGMRLR